MTAGHGIGRRRDDGKLQPHTGYNRMYAAHGTEGGERVEITRKARRRLREAELLASRDLLMLEYEARGWTHERIAGTFRVARQLVSFRLRHRVPGKVRDAMARAAFRYRDGLPAEVSDRLRAWLLEERDREREDRRAG